MTARLAEILTENSDDVSLVVRHFPLEVHPQARAAARAAVCAEDQAAFPRMNDLLFAQVDSFGYKPWLAFAKEAGVADTVAFATCLRDPRSEAAVEADLADARKLRLFGTPSLMIDGDVFFGNPHDLERIVQGHIIEEE